MEHLLCIRHCSRAGNVEVDETENLCPPELTFYDILLVYHTNDKHADY